MKTTGQWKPKIPDYTQCEAEGWAIFETGIQDTIHNKFELQCIDDLPHFGEDAEAQEFVFSKAEQGSKLHLQAMFFLCKESPNEVDNHIRHTVGSYRLNDFLNQHRITL